MKSRHNYFKRDKYSGKKRRADLSFLTKFMIFIGFAICLLGFLVALTGCVDRLSEFLNGMGYQNKWNPLRGSFLQIIENLPGNLYICVTKFLEATFASIIFFPLVILAVPLYDLFFYGDFAILLYGFLPIIVGLIIIFAAIITSDKKPA